MILAIDPDLFSASEFDGVCKLVLQKILEKVCEDDRFEYRFALDGQDIENEYLDFYNKNLKTGNRDNPAFLLLDYIFKNSQYRAITLPPELPQTLQELIEHHNCKTPVEPQLIGMAYYSRKLGGLHILLAGPTVAQEFNSLRVRGLYKRETQEEFSKVLDGVEIVFADDAVHIELPFLLEKTLETEETEADSQFKIFLSYARPENEIEAKKLYNGLKENGYRPWFDQESLKSGQVWKYEIEKYIPKADIVIVLFSAQANRKRGYYQKEKKLAIETSLEIPDEDIFLIPVNLDGCAIPEPLKKFNCENFAIDWQSGFSRLLNAIKEQHNKKLALQ